MNDGLKLGLAVACTLAPLGAQAQTATNLAVLKGLAPVTVLARTAAGRAALGANFAVTGGIQTGTLRPSTPLPFAEQQQQALRDAFITDGDLSELADGLGTTLGAAYQARAHYLDREHFTSLSPAVADLIAYTNAVTGGGSQSGKYFFANATRDGKAPVSDDAAAILKASGGATDPFGRAYGRPGGSPGADAFGDSRPFQTEPNVLQITGPDYFGVPANNDVYNRGPISNLIDSPSFPSGHTTYGYMGGILLAVLVPSRYRQSIARAAEYGHDRILMGAHYAMDVLGGRTLATYDLAHLLANDPAYVGQTLKDYAAPFTPGQPRRDAPVLTDYRAAVKAAQADMAAALAAGCGDAVDSCARQDIGRFSDPTANRAFIASTQTYGLPVVYPETAGRLEDVGALAPEAGYLLTAAFPALTLEEADRILTETEGPGGGFLDDGSAFGVYSRLDLSAAAARAAPADRK
ncbi:phosphatase PAP2 family protein [Lichenibacterium minor]|uniref:Phosphatase PAP2 family protein n=1 Tax=Lichenibacterium minor TaxID=2316528 RepID=A0A4Q2U809_9HYPH|nr:phosphatase PAP2 family protein [Lichenibacterium minor]RYC31177.1 phosphatase PAP2 family protein [Lichenibacterium minor]